MVERVLGVSDQRVRDKLDVTVVLKEVKPEAKLDEFRIPAEYCNTVSKWCFQQLSLQSTWVPGETLEKKC